MGAQNLIFTVLSSSAAIPEPATWISLLSGMAVFAAFRRIRRYFGSQRV